MTASEVRAWLDGLDQARAAATAGPWRAEPNFTGGWALARARIEDPDETPVHTPSGWTGDDAALIVAAVNALGPLVAIVRDIWDEHDGRTCPDRSGYSFDGIEPCATRQMIIEELRRAAVTAAQEGAGQS